ncbi:hypothetical protein DL93DRAFT_2081000 [Clavulina sp. PMI_390]|nr:hypothetical protein DL93DRAFT_2081000 [Clavulina sp. PMI_390]
MFLPTSPPLLGEAGAEKVLKVLRVRGNKLDEAALNDLAKIGQDMKEDGDNGIKERWKGLELDLRENEIGKLPGALGWLPLDVLLVESNAFRVPNRRVWERDGTKGLQAFLKAMAD